MIKQKTNSEFLLIIKWDVLRWISKSKRNTLTLLCKKNNWINMARWCMRSVSLNNLHRQFLKIWIWNGNMETYSVYTTSIHTALLETYSVYTTSIHTALLETYSVYTTSIHTALLETYSVYTTSTVYTRRCWRHTRYTQLVYTRYCWRHTRYTQLVRYTHGVAGDILGIHN